MIEEALKHRLRSLVGHKVEYCGQQCRVIEVLDSEQALVVQCMSQTVSAVIQGNQYGEATRRVQACHTIRLYDETNQLDPDIDHWLNQASL
ncbi:hypothetical protein DFR30_1641 [Thiogranum longum]|uniref:Uncharacterized protein n=1 Tax=Thiogranum longum TaxID=1537524 RepID=A0A4R1HCR9_9GAMM|nr:hypothetical protein [Thiogranum longum]TCK18363.1 hypothetical protein DFR30_1641 [Thiogranum longum]